MGRPSPYRSRPALTAARRKAHTFGIWLLVIQVASVMWLGVALYDQLIGDPNFAPNTQNASGPGFSGSPWMGALGFFFFVVNCFAGLFWNLIAEKHHKALVVTATFFLVGYFAYFNIYLFKALGTAHYVTDGKAGFVSWFVYAGQHFVHAGDMLDILREYGIDLEPIKYQSTLSRIVLVLFYAGTGVNLYQIFLPMLLKLAPVLEDFWKKVKQLRGPLLGIVLLLAYVTAWFQGWSWWSWITWPLDNIFRTIDFMDVMQVFEWQWHDAPPTFWNHTLAVAFRIGVGLYLLSWIDEMQGHYRGKLGLDAPAGWRRRK